MASPNVMQQIDVVPCLCFREPFGSLSHLIGAAVFAGLAFELIRRGRGERTRMISLTVFAAASVLMLLASGLYHTFWPGPIRDLMLKVDVAAVFALIAASMTPVHAILFSGVSRWLALVFIWTIAVVGIVVRTVYFHSFPGPIGIALFVSFGWSGVITAAKLCHRFGWKFILPVFLSAMAYSFGALGLALHRPILVPGIIGPHEIWHVAVLVGLGFHWQFVNQFATGQIRVLQADLQVAEESIGHISPSNSATDFIDSTDVGTMRAS